jgi:hypothetical protein
MQPGAVLFQQPSHSPANFGIFGHDDVFQHFEDRDANPEFQPDGGHFNADDAPADNNGLSGDAIVVQSLVRGLHQPTVYRNKTGYRRPRAGRQDHVTCSVLSGGGVRHVDAHRLRIQQLTPTVSQVDVMTAKDFAQAGGQAGDRLTLAGAHLVPIYRQVFGPAENS